MGVAPQRDDRVVLEEEERIGDGLGLALGDQPRLELETFRVGQAAEPADGQGAGNRGAGGRAHSAGWRTVRGRTRRTPAGPS